jgi:hypothetical protein
MTYGIQNILLRGSIAFVKFGFIITTLAVASPATKRGLNPSQASAQQGPAVTANFTDREVPANHALTFTLSQPLPGTGERLAVLIGKTDFTNLFSPNGDGFTYQPLLPLPAGESSVGVFMVTPANEWLELARFTLRIRPPSAPDTAQSQSQGQTRQPASAPAQSPTANRYIFAPSLTLGTKSQIAERHFPDSNRPDRPTYADVMLQASLKSEVSRNWFSSQMQFDMVGSSFQNEALRFGERGNEAPSIDLSNYLMQFQLNKSKIQVGHVAFGTNRHLINSYGSRGLSFTTPIGTRSDLSLAAINGTSIVGWNNFFGLDRRKHQIVSATFGLELLDKRPGGFRLEAAALHGSLLPIAGFNQGVINDAEKSHGASLRLVASDKAQRLKLGGGFTRSRFDNPSDPLLNHNLPVVPVREAARNAFYLDTSYDLLQNLKLSETRTANLRLNYRLERVDPLFRSVAASTQADRFQHEVEMTGSIGQITATGAHQRFSDNLADIPSILKTLSRRYAVMISVPLASVRSAAHQSPWLPRLSYSSNRIHQFGRAFPVNSGFDSTSQVPDQISTIHDFSSEWQHDKWRLTYRFNYSLQDNRQPGREAADLMNLVNGLTLGLNPHASFDLNFDLNIENAKNLEVLRTDRTLRAGINTNWRITPKMTLNAIASNTLAGDIGRISRNRNTEFDLQWSYKFTAGETRWRKLQGQFFVRYADRYARMRDSIFGFDNMTRLKTLNCGLSFVFF